MKNPRETPSNADISRILGVLGAADGPAATVRDQEAATNLMNSLSPNIQQQVDSIRAHQHQQQLPTSHPANPSGSATTSNTAAFGSGGLSLETLGISSTALAGLASLLGSGQQSSPQPPAESHQWPPQNPGWQQQQHQEQPQQWYPPAAPAPQHVAPQGIAPYPTRAARGGGRGGGSRGRGKVCKFFNTRG